MPIHQNNLFKAQYRYYSSYPSHTVLGLPALSPSMEAGVISKWRKNEGDSVKAGEVIAEVDTDKAKVDWESNDDGFVAKIVVEAGIEVKLGQVVAILVENKDDVAAFANYAPPAAKAAKAPEPAPAAAPKQAAPSAPAKSQPAVAKPSAPQPVQKPAPPPAAIEDVDFTDFPHSAERKALAGRLTETKQAVPHYYLTIEINIDKALNLQNELNSRAKGAYQISLNDFVIKAAALALRKVPEVNAKWNETSIRRYQNVHINVSFASGAGIYSPVILDTDNKGLVQISNLVRDLEQKAQSSQLTPGDLKVGTFTVSNLGSFGIEHYRPIVSAPQACTLAVGTVEQKLVPKEKPGAENPFAVSSFVNATLSCDHRLVDGALGAVWLQQFKTLLEDPVNLLL